MLSNTEINLVSSITSCGGVGIRRVGRNQGRRVGCSSDGAATMRKAETKDAKANFPAVIAPVQLTGLSCRECDALPDHTWDLSRTNALTPMTFLFLETKVTGTTTDVTGTHIKYDLRSGQGETLLNLSFFKPDTTSKSLNELHVFLLLLSLPALDS